MRALVTVTPHVLSDTLPSTFLCESPAHTVPALSICGDAGAVIGSPVCLLCLASDVESADGTVERGD